MNESEQEAHCQCCGSYVGNRTTDPEYCGACVDAGEPPESWENPASRVSMPGSRGSGPTKEQLRLRRLRGRDLEENVPWEEIIPNFGGEDGVE